jgi:hypothetical protein
MATGLIRHLDPEIDITRCYSRHADDPSADPFDPNRRGFRREFIGPYKLPGFRVERTKHEIGLSRLV